MFVRATCTAALLVAALATTSAIWIEPEVKASLSIRSNVTGAQPAGTGVQYVCAATGLIDTNTLGFYHHLGTVEWGMYCRGRSELKLSRALRSSDAGSALLCSAVYYARGRDAARLGTARRRAARGDSDEYDSLNTYYVNSDLFPLQVAAGASTTLAPAIARETVTMSSNASSTTQRAGDVVKFTCTTANMPFVVLDVRIAKGNLELKLHEGWQRTRVMIFRVTAADHGTNIYCKAWRIDDDYNSYSIDSNRLPINVHP